MKKLLMLLLLSVKLFSAQPDTFLVIFAENERPQPQIQQLQRQVSTEECSKCSRFCKDNKVKLALIGFGTATLTAVTTLIIHFTSCK